jgi:ElaB/YqjD/DUF883 family membrane-anchored ribosome-binding protein
MKRSVMETNYEAIAKAHSAAARERVLADLQTLTRDTEDLLKATAGDVSEKAREVRNRVSAALARAKVTCTHLQEQTAATARAAAKRADLVVREHPYESIGIAFGVGLLLGVLVARK